jgi:hypothetical protein
MGDNSPELDAEYRKIAVGYYDDWQAGRDPAGISTQDDTLAARLDPVVAADASPTTSASSHSKRKHSLVPAEKPTSTTSSPKTSSPSR